MQIETALDWQEVSDRLKTDLHRMGYNPDLKKMYDNIQLMVTELSKLEVNGRRIKSTNFTQNEVEKINKAIDHLEKLILMGLLMK
jgi:coenzyme F420-reducing hydrogenase delta subunit